MTNSEKVDAYIKKHSKWSDKLQQLREALLQTKLTEEVKWGAPTYTYDGDIVVGIAGFKNHYALWFHQGVFLKDPEKVLITAKGGNAKAMRQWRFEEGDSIDTAMVKKYAEEAIANSKAGKKVKPANKKGVNIPPLLKKALSEDNKLKKAFSNLTPGKQREYADHIGSAKQEATRKRRLDKAVPMILNGKGLYDKYKDC
ncbi:YdeI/OmpD-associated family protein [Flavobacteriaceae bacterium TK19130]|nr:YdeI/OmpD-associated family protein [Thermobacterium salinum]